MLFDARVSISEAQCAECHALRRILGSPLVKAWRHQQISNTQAMRLRDTKGQALTADRSHVAQTKEVMLCVHLISLPTIVLPLASTGYSPCSTRSAAWKARYRAIRPTISRGPARTTIVSRLQSPASPTLIS